MEFSHKSNYKMNPVGQLNSIGTALITGGFDTNWDGHHDGGVVGRGGQFPLSGWMFLNNLH